MFARPCEIMLFKTVYRFAQNLIGIHISEVFKKNSGNLCNNLILTERVALNINDFFTIAPSRTLTRKLIFQESAPKTVLRSKFFSKRVLVPFRKLVKDKILCLSLTSFKSFIENRLNDL
ncbi:hypothetical protein Y032_0431g1335 [Ancylostoma ceylanicum]|uniref:Uncharacterized protein n=1 Tax=Ancylostoma ceylanicum TaxID=53326 RepID=A0A016X0C1_9BILA|nr:hypothetical protein Y032_0431g1335 [Ancylostoma ceylanicum]